MRLIDADAFLEENKVFADRDFCHPLYEDTLRDLVDAAPTVNAIELPCEPRSTVYVIDGDEVVRMIANYFMIGATKELYAELVNSLVLTKKKTVVNATAFQKTVFLTKEEAEAAMSRKRKDV